MSRWPVVAFGEILTPNRRPYLLGDDEDANLVGMRLYALGPFHRELKPAGQIRKKSHFVIRQGDVIYNKLFAWKGTFGIVPPELDGMFVSDKFPTYALDDTRVDPNYLRWYFRCPEIWEQARRLSTGSAALSKLTLNPPKFLDLTMPLPPIEEQRRVAEKLNRLATQSKRLGNLQRHVEGAVDALLLARLNKFFGDPYQGTVGDGGFAEFAPVGELSSDVADGPHATPQYVDYGIPFVTVLNITSGRVDFNGAKHITPAAHELYSKRAKAESGDVLISKDGTLGVPCYVDTDREFSFFVSVALVKPRRDFLDGRFLTWALRAPYLQDRIVERSRGDMIRHLVLREIRQLLVPVVPLEAQRRIVSGLDAAEFQHRSLSAASRDSQSIAAAVTRSALAASFAV